MRADARPLWRAARAAAAGEPGDRAVSRGQESAARARSGARDSRWRDSRRPGRSSPASRASPNSRRRSAGARSMRIICSVARKLRSASRRSPPTRRSQRRCASKRSTRWRFGTSRSGGTASPACGAICRKRGTRRPRSPPPPAFCPRCSRTALKRCASPPRSSPVRCESRRRSLRCSLRSAIAKAGGKVRAAALRSLAAMQSPKLADAVKVALGDKDKALLEAARQLAGKASPALAVQVNAAVLGKGSIREQQEALATIGAQPVPEADRALEAQLDLLLAGKLPAPLALDLARSCSAACRRRGEAEARRLRSLAERRAIRSRNGANAWKAATRRKAARSSRRKPKPAAIAATKSRASAATSARISPVAAVQRDRAHLLQSIVEPSAAITPGYENVLVTLKNGEMVAGLLNAEDARGTHARFAGRWQKAEVEEGGHQGTHHRAERDAAGPRRGAGQTRPARRDRVSGDGEVAAVGLAPGGALDPSADFGDTAEDRLPADLRNGWRGDVERSVSIRPPAAVRGGSPRTALGVECSPGDQSVARRRLLRALVPESRWAPV